ncbi:hypothetical protein FA13DRAFT_947331 [Coprinellus micaceus]|uniref:Uncharacterized protein n=1 Tax=Coprinellus micaceus TaxID=71717 RepID=A0A4Y7SZI0_COPMI|nr:hypothetical protein FA13DRAFT_947331 [Coprinellus micaceus]
MRASPRGRSVAPCPLDHNHTLFSMEGKFQLPSLTTFQPTTPTSTQAPPPPHPVRPNPQPPTPTPSDPSPPPSYPSDGVTPAAQRKRFPSVPPVSPAPPRKVEATGSPGPTSDTLDDGPRYMPASHPLQPMLLVSFQRTRRLPAYTHHHPVSGLPHTGLRRPQMQEASDQTGFPLNDDGGGGLPSRVRPTKIAPPLLHGCTRGRVIFV